MLDDILDIKNNLVTKYIESDYTILTLRLPEFNENKTLSKIPLL